MFGRRYFGDRYFGERYFGPRLPVVYTITGSVTPVALLLGDVCAIYGVPPLLTPTAVLLGTISTSGELPNILIVEAELLGVLRVITSGIDREGRARELGYRPSTPLLVYSLDAEAPADTIAAVVPVDGYFLVSPTFDFLLGGTFAEAGARQDYIGQRKVPDTGPDFFIFRAPEAWEPVWYVDNTGDEPFARDFYRYEHDTWLRYRTKPQRSLDATRAFDILDPDGVYDYYARVVAACLVQWAYDNEYLLRFSDPNLCPLEFLPLLAANYGMTFTEEDTEQARRQKLKSAVPSYKLKGLGLAVAIRLNALGYSGYSHEIRVKPEAVWGPGAVNDAGATDTTFITDLAEATDDFFNGQNIQFETGALTGEMRKIKSYSGATKTIEVVDPFSAAPANTDEFTIHGAWDDIANAPAYIQADAFARGNLFSIDPDSGEKGEAFYEIPHGYTLAAPETFFPSSRLVIHVNNPDGSALDEVAMTQAQIDEMKERIARELIVDILPAHVDIRYFATDFEVAQ